MNWITMLFAVAALAIVLGPRYELSQGEKATEQAVRSKARAANPDPFLVGGPSLPPFLQEGGERFPILGDTRTLDPSAPCS
jgi:hypothetical protein